MRKRLLSLHSDNTHRHCYLCLLVGRTAQTLAANSPCKKQKDGTHPSFTHALSLQAVILRKQFFCWRCILSVPHSCNCHRVWPTKTHLCAGRLCPFWQAWAKFCKDREASPGNIKIPFHTHPVLHGTFHPSLHTGCPAADRWQFFSLL